VPQRIQLRRTRGWRKPPGALVVARPSRWGNPFPITPEITRSQAVERYRAWLAEPEQAELVAGARRGLAGHDLACWCPLDEPCHADVLLEVVNA
jgi:hypothetical protein